MMTRLFDDHADTIATTTAFMFTTMYTVHGIAPPFFVGIPLPGPVPTGSGQGDESE